MKVRNIGIDRGGIAGEGVVGFKNSYLNKQGLLNILRTFATRSANDPQAYSKMVNNRKIAESIRNAIKATNASTTTSNQTLNHNASTQTSNQILYYLQAQNSTQVRNAINKYLQAQNPDQVRIAINQWRKWANRK